MLMYHQDSKWRVAELCIIFLMWKEDARLIYKFQIWSVKWSAKQSTEPVCLTGLPPDHIVVFCHRLMYFLSVLFLLLEFNYILQKLIFENPLLMRCRGGVFGGVWEQVRSWRPALIVPSGITLLSLDVLCCSKCNTRRFTRCWTDAHVPGLLRLQGHEPNKFQFLIDFSL